MFPPHHPPLLLKAHPPRAFKCSFLPGSLNSQSWNKPSPMPTLPITISSFCTTTVHSLSPMSPDLFPWFCVFRELHGRSDWPVLTLLHPHCLVYSGCSVKTRRHECCVAPEVVYPHSGDRRGSRAPRLGGAYCLLLTSYCTLMMHQELTCSLQNPYNTHPT